MNRERIKQLLPIMQAFAEGKQIQFKYSVDGSWTDVADTNFTAAPEKYRIKPEVKKVKCWLLVDNETGCIPSYRPFASKEAAEEYLSSGCFLNKYEIVEMKGSYEV